MSKTHLAWPKLHLGWRKSHVAWGGLASRSFRVTFTDVDSNPIWYTSYGTIDTGLFKMTVQALDADGNDDTTYVPTVGGLDVTFSGPYSSIDVPSEFPYDFITATGWSGGHKTVTIYISDSFSTALTTTDCVVIVTDNYASPTIIGYGPIVMVPVYNLSQGFHRWQKFHNGEWPNNPYYNEVLSGASSRNGKDHLGSPRNGYAVRSLMYGGNFATPFQWPTYEVASASLVGVFSKYESGEVPTPPGFEALNIYNQPSGSIQNVDTYNVGGVDLLNSIASSTAEGSVTVSLDVVSINASAGQPARILLATKTEVDGGGRDPYGYSVYSWATVGIIISFVLAE